MVIKILTEGGTGIGLGHVARCKALFDEAVAQGYDVQIIVNTSDESISMLDDVNVQYLDWRDPEFIEHHIENGHYLIVDSYLANQDIYEQLVNQSAHCLILDDFHRMPYPKHSTVVNISLNEPKIKDRSFSGRDYIILRAPFSEVITKDIQRHVKRVFITLGSAGEQATQSLIDNLTQYYPSIHLYVLISGNASLKISAEQQVQVLKNLDPREMMEQFIESDIVITAAGQTMFEVIKTGTPFIPVSTVDNQRQNVSSLMNNDLVEQVVLSKSLTFDQDILQQFQNLLRFDVRQAISLTLRNFIDGQGSKRVMQILMKNH
ncbi:spore coat polysaccharide biosynthesis predicted glycosyltransferase SpsG [Alkalibacillus flavidus]|uniref:Spore coat polysaccharide biosynthesis predicted glycosyltransferase SpsG n=1 Tax=Alkalibacillus flavidus TaxID=546021 RepID=A0ABV2KWA7_9BACI